MDVYTTSFTYPRRPRLHGHAHNHASTTSLEFPTQGVADLSHLNNGSESSSSSSADVEAVQKLSMMAMSMHGCHVSYFLADQCGGWNFHVTGAYQQVMVARGMILKECPIQVYFLVLFILILILTYTSIMHP
jgi:hypothetical protein